MKIAMEASCEKPLLLIADDEPANIQVLVAALRNDYRIKVATDGGIALELARRTAQPDLIILDVMMPVMDGFEVCRKLKEDKATKHIPVMFVTSLNSLDDELEGLELEAVEFITKPFNPLTLRMRVRNLVRLKLLQDKLLEMSTHDALTGLANRRYFDQFLDNEWRRAMRTGSGLGLIMLDIDLFKQFNDHYGHIEGDRGIQQVAKELSTVLQRPGDLAARYGGEELVGILTEASLEGVMAIAEQCRVRIEALQIPHARSPYGVLTVSGGVHVITPNAVMSTLDLIASADEKLYLAKAGGRNRIIHQI